MRFPLQAEVERLLPGAHLRVPASVRDEVDRLVERGVRGARVAAALARTFPSVSVQGRGDAAVLEAATRLHAWVVTADRALAVRLRRNGVGVLVPRDRQRLEARDGGVPPPRTLSVSPRR